MRKCKHFGLALSHCLRLIVGDEHSLVGVFPGDGCLIYLKLNTLQVRNIDAFEILFVGCLQQNLLFSVVHFNGIRFFWVGKVSNAPLEAVFSVFAFELRVGVGGAH